MERLRLIIAELMEPAGRLGGVAGQILQDRLDLLALELREAKIRWVQAMLLACMGVLFSLLGLLLLLLAGAYALPPEWRLYGLAAEGAASLLAGATAFTFLRRRLGRKPTAFAQSLAELKKDTECFSTRN